MKNKNTYPVVLNHFIVLILVCGDQVYEDIKHEKVVDYGI